MSGYGTHGVEVIVEIAFGFAPFETVTAWTDVTGWLHKLTMTRGSVASALPRAIAGTCVLELNNDDGRFDPGNTSSPYSPDVTLSTPIRVMARDNDVTSPTYGDLPMFYGHIKSWNITYPHKGIRSVAVVPCVDALQRLNDFDISDKTYPAEETDVRIGKVLDDIGWPAAMRRIDSKVGYVEAFDQTAEMSAYTHLIAVAGADVGSVFVAADGFFVFYNRVHYSDGGNVEAIYGPADHSYESVTPRYDDDYLYNDIRVTRTGGVEQTATDATSIAAYLARMLKHGGIMDNDNEAANVADWELALYKDVKPRVGEVKLKVHTSLPAWQDVVGRDIQDQVTVRTDPIGGGDGFDQQVTIESMRTTFSVDRWDVTFGCYPLSDIETAYYWVLDEAQLGPVALVNWVLGTSTLGVDTSLHASLVGPPTVLA